MCMLIFQKEGKRITKEQALRFKSANPDGFGLMYVENTNLVIYKSLDFEDFFAEYLTRCNLIGNKTPMVLHFRAGSSGYISLDNCHPFFSSETVGFAHNGVMTEFSGDKEFSDTYMFNEKIVKPIVNDLFTCPETTILLKEFIGTYNKLVFLNNKKEFLIINEEEGVWLDDIWFSNKWGVHTGSSYYYYKKDKTNNRNTDNSLDRCISCGKKLIGQFNIFIRDDDYNEAYVCPHCAKSHIKLKSILKKMKFAEEERIRKISESLTGWNDHYELGGV